MKDQSKTKQSLIQELASLRERLKELEKSEAECKRAEAALRESEERFTKAFRSIPDALVISRLEDGKIVEVNDSWHMVFGYSREEVIGKNSLALNLFADSADRKRAMVMLREQGFVRDFELQIRQKSGALRTAILSIELQETQGEQYLLSVVQDVTEHKQAEDALRASEGLLRGLFENMTSGAAIYEVINDGSKGSDYIIRDFNVTSLRIEGKRKDEVIGKSLFDLRPNIDQYGLIPIFQKVWRTGKPGYFPSTIYIDEGYSNWYENRVFKLPTGEIVAIYDDVTERKKAEVALKETNEILGTIIRSSPLAIIAIDPEGNVMRWNQAAEQMFGWLEREVLGQFLPIVSEDKRNEHLKLRERVLRGEAFTNVEVRRRKKDGSSIDINLSGAPLHDSQDRMTGIMSLSADITDRKRAEEELQASENKYRYLVENINDVIFTLNKEGRFTYMSPVAEQVLGYSPVALIGHPFSELIYPEDLPLVITAFNNVQSDILKYNEYRILNKFGKIQWIRSSSRPNYINGNVNGIIGIAVDITEQKLAAIAVTESEDHYRSLFDNMGGGVAVYKATDDGEDFFFIDLNKGGEKLSQLDRSQVIGRSVREILPGIREMGLFEVFKKVWKTGEPQYHPVSLYQDDRISQYFENYVYKLPSGDIVAVYDNVTARKQAEEELRNSHLQLRALATRLQQIREEDRIAIAREIHDEMGGGLTGLKMDLSWLSRKIDDTDRGEERIALMDRIHASNVLIDQMIQVVRRVSAHLRPSVLNDVGLID